MFNSKPYPQPSTIPQWTAPEAATSPDFQVQLLAAVQEQTAAINRMTGLMQTLILALAEQDLDEAPEAAGFFLDGTPK